MKDEALLEVLKMAKIGAIIRVNPETTLQVVSTQSVGCGTCRFCYFKFNRRNLFYSGRCLESCSVVGKESLFVKVDSNTQSTANKKEFTLFTFNLKGDYRYER